MKLSNPNPTAKSGFVAKPHKSQLDKPVQDKDSDYDSQLQAEVDAGNDDRVESELVQGEEILEIQEQVFEIDVSKEASENNHLENDNENKLVEDVFDVESSTDTNSLNAFEDAASTSIDENVTDLVEESVELNGDLLSEVDESEVSELIVAHHNEDPEIDLLLTAIPLSEIQVDGAKLDSAAEDPGALPIELALLTEQPIAEFVNHKLINMEIKHIVEAALFASGSAMSVSRLYRVFDEDERPERSEIRAALTILQQDYADKAVQLVEVAGGFRFQVKSDYAVWVARLFQERPPKYSRALLETLSIIAYRQPVTRGDIENIRGVSVSTQIIQTLQEREWVKVVGHKEVPGKPALFATTADFLDYFNLKSLTDLPPLSEFIIPDEISDQQQDASTEDENKSQNQQSEEDQSNQTESVTIDTSSH